MFRRPYRFEITLDIVWLVLMQSLRAKREMVISSFFILFYLFLVTAPSSPLNFAVSSVSGSPNQLSASWSPPMNGYPIAYTVYCNISTNQAYPEQMIGPNVPMVRSVVNGIPPGPMSMFIPPITMTTFNTGLEPYTFYDCYVTANTSVGEGPPSQIMTARTDQSSKHNPDKRTYRKARIRKQLYKFAVISKKVQILFL